MKTLYNSMLFSVSEEEVLASRALDEKLTEEERGRKRVLARRLRAYRRTFGLGSFLQLAQFSGVSAGIIRQMNLAIPTPYEYWEKVEKALDAFGVEAWPQAM